MNTQARKHAANLVQLLRDGEISNFEFEARWPTFGEKDRAIEAIQNMLWRYYDDFHEHKLSGDYILSEEGRDLFDRCISFLISDLEYKWPEDTVFRLRTYTPSLLDISDTSLSLERQRLIESRVIGPEAIWPFFTLEDYNFQISNFRGRSTSLPEIDAS